MADTNLVIGMSVRMGNLEAGLRKASDRMKDLERQTRQAKTGMLNFSREVNQLGTGISSVFGSIRGVIGPALAIFTTGALVGSINGAIQRVNALADAATQVGVSVEELQTLQIAFEEAGSSSQVAEQGLGRLQTLLGDAVRGSKTAQESFIEMGVSFRNIDGSARTASQAMNDLRERIIGAASEQEKLSIAAQVFGQRGARAAVAALQELNGTVEEAQERYARLGLIVSTDTAKQLDNLGTAFANLGRAIVTHLADAIAAITPQLESFLQWLLEQVNATAGVMRGLQRQNQVYGDSQWQTLSNRAVQAESQAREARRRLEELANVRPATSSLDLFGWTPEALDRERQARTQAAELAERSARAAREEANQRLNINRLLADLPATPAQPVTPGPRGEAPRITGTGPLADRARGGTQRLTDAQKEAEKLAQALIRAGESANRANDPLSDLRQQMEAVTAAFAAGSISATTYQRAIEGGQAALDRMIQSSEEATTKQTSFWDAFQRGAGADPKQNDRGFIADIGEGIGKISSQAFDDLFNLFDKIAEGSVSAAEGMRRFALTFVQSIAKMVAQAAAMRLIQAFFASIGGGTYGQLPGFGAPKMAGGAVAGGYTYLVGERGPELFTAPGVGRIIPNHELVGGGGMNVVINQNAPGVLVRTQQVDERTVMVAVNMSRDQVSRDYRESMRRGYGSYSEPLSHAYNVRRRV